LTYLFITYNSQHNGDGPLKEIFVLLGCYAARLVVSYRRFGTNCRSHLQRSSTVCNHQSVLLNIQQSADIIYKAAEAWNYAKWIISS